MNKEETEKEDRGISMSIPLLTQEEINGIDLNMNKIINQFTKIVVKEKDLVIAQYIIKRQEEKIKELQQKESILDKVTDKLKKDIENDYCIEKIIGDNYIATGVERYSIKPYAQEILNIIEGEKK